jgi:restriction endonuclease
VSDNESPPAWAISAVPTPTVTRVPWDSVTGIQLEELLYGLLDAMGASSLAWRAGSSKGVTATDGGRDLEAVFDRPSPDGELDRQRWWIESKGRTNTVERGAVQQAVLDASARSDIDILVIATNSRFSNPTRDWVTERASSYTRPVVKLWDRDNLDRLVRMYPTVVARVLPDALSDEERLRLLVARFEELGEEPTQLDLEFFWTHQ